MKTQTTTNTVQFELPILKDTVQYGNLIGIFGQPGNLQCETAVWLLKQFAECNQAKITGDGTSPLILHISMGDYSENRIEWYFRTLTSTDKSTHSCDTYFEKSGYIRDTFQKGGYWFAIQDKDSGGYAVDPDSLVSNFRRVINNYAGLNYDVRAVAVTTNKPMEILALRNLARAIRDVCQEKSMVGILTCANNPGASKYWGLQEVDVGIETSLVSRDDRVGVLSELIKCRAILKESVESFTELRPVLADNR